MKRYEIHDNGGRPFIVEVHPDHVIVHKQDYDFDTEAYLPPKKILKRAYKHIFIGDKSPFQRPVNWNPNFVGNTLLLQQENGKYIFIGPSIEEFRAEKGDTIEHYFSDIGNNDVPYPYALGKTHAYFFSDNNGKVTSVPLNYFFMEKDLYDQLWLDHRLNDCKYQPAARASELCKLWKKKDPELKERLDYLTAHKKHIKTKTLEERL